MKTLAVMLILASAFLLGALAAIAKVRNFEISKLSPDQVAITCAPGMMFKAQAISRTTVKVSCVADKQ